MVKNMINKALAIFCQSHDGRILEKISAKTPNVNKIIAPKVKGLDVLGQKELDKLMIELDGTKTKSKLGANAILSVSMAACCAAAADSELPLYEYVAFLDRLYKMRYNRYVGRFWF